MTLNPKQKQADNTSASSGSLWHPTKLDNKLPPYLSLVQALSTDIESGRLRPGDRLPPHRDLARDLGLSIGTVSKAYREAQSRGYLSSHVGQGTFAIGKAAPKPPLARNADFINLGLNQPPRHSQLETLQRAMQETLNSPYLEELFAYHQHQGRPEHREVIAGWMARQSFKPSPDQLIICNGAQHAIDIAIRLSTKPGQSVATDALTYFGFKAVADVNNIGLTGIAMDAQGMLPEALDEACGAYDIHCVYLMPTLQTPTARTMSEARRRAIAKVAERHRLMIIEDNVYGFFAETAPISFAELLPDQTIYIESFSKCLLPAFRVGMAVIPPALMDRAILFLHATSWMSSSFLVEAASRMIKSGALQDVIAASRTEARARYKIFQEELSGHVREELPNPSPGNHVWLNLGEDWTSASFYFAAHSNGILVSPPDSVNATLAPLGVRLCLGGVDRHEDLRLSLRKLRSIMETPSSSIVSFV
ncbi:transcriptional regulator, GntR family [Arboricoccus pini]|uniref:Transcriptional regulator, GntR family n=1 Tax=Arboricoccus pini TaxID=1963835 RepID=A0A212RWG4_9PROT|nr:PLP-dependent aminotransferase family protein [Arboricoccus pini]SNB77109.1 transcriptional regulator, GntR family [Arboricoccus pini]